jgi:hypothetical protein
VEASLVRNPLKQLVFIAFVVIAFSAFSFADKDDFRPVNQQELAMKDNPAQPGAHAMVLEWTDDTDDTFNCSCEKVYFRIKIFTAEGKKHGDIEIPFLKSNTQINNIKARTIRPDGTIVPFSGQVFEKMVIKSRDFKFLAKTFTLPDVQPGSIVEYRYIRNWETGWIRGSHWEPQTDLFVKKAHFSIKPYEGEYAMYWQAFRLPIGAQVKKGDNHVFYLDLENIPAFDEEEYRPPVAELKPRVEFFYSEKTIETDIDKYWKRIGKEWNDAVEDFIGNRGGIRNAVATIISPSDTNEQKVQKIYARVQQVKNLTYHEEKSELERKKEKVKDINNVEDVWKNQYGHRSSINRLFVALARAAGFQAVVVRIGQRDDVFFKKGLQDENQLNGEVAIVNVDNKDVWLDPGTPFCPYGLLSWENTGVQGIRLAKDGGTFVVTPQPDHTQAIMARTARLKWEDGALNGKVYVQFRGQRALRWRLRMIEDDDAGLKKEMEDEVKGWFPEGSTVKLASIKDARTSTQMLDVDFDVNLVGIGSAVGSRLLLPGSIFQAAEKNPFRFEKRVHPVYFRFPYQELDEVTIELPSGLNAENLPTDVVQQTNFAYYDNKWSKTGNVLMVQRRFAMMGFVFRNDLYPNLKDFFEKVNTRDQETAVLRAAK